jgi:hypothetical protein
MDRISWKSLELGRSPLKSILQDLPKKLLGRTSDELELADILWHAVSTLGKWKIWKAAVYPTLCHRSDVVEYL